jgi:hypothetical protein
MTDVSGLGLVASGATNLEFPRLLRLGAGCSARTIPEGDERRCCHSAARLPMGRRGGRRFGVPRSPLPYAPDTGPVAGMGLGAWRDEASVRPLD